MDLANDRLLDLVTEVLREEESGSGSPGHFATAARKLFRVLMPDGGLGSQGFTAFMAEVGIHDASVVGTLRRPRASSSASSCPTAAWAAKASRP
jgi:hypothetical protein